MEPWHEPRSTSLSSGGAFSCYSLCFYLSLSCRGTTRHLFPESFVNCWHGSYCSDSILLFRVFPALGLKSLKLSYLTCQGLSRSAHLGITKWWWFSHSVMSDSCDPVDHRLPGSCVPGISQARLLKWVAISFSRGSSQPRDQIWVSCISGGFFTGWITRESSRGLAKHRLLGPVPRVSDSIGLGWGLRMCIVSKRPSGADAAHLGCTLRTTDLGDLTLVLDCFVSFLYSPQ